VSARRPDAIVVGAGIVGAACARALAQETRKVLVLDASFAGGGSTAAGMGHVVVMDDSEEQLALTRYSRLLWEELADGLPPAAERERRGTLWVAEDAEQMEAVRAKAAYYGARGVAAEVLDERAVAECEPELRPGLSGGLRVPDDSVVYPPAVTRHLLDQARALGASLREGCRVDGVGAGWVRAGEARLEAEVVVVAAGAETPRLLPALPLVPRKGHLAITDRHPGFCRHQLVELGYLRSAHEMSEESVAFNVQPRATGQLLVGSSRELVGWDGRVNRRVLGRMLERAVHFLPRLARLPVVRAWTGFRPATRDKLPYIGRWDETPGLWVAAGHEGLGITTSLGTARLLADLVAGREPGIDPAPFAPSRVLASAAGDA
jgi:glycine/D-amino acid oxidase-like deaminating enzyme